MVIHVMVMSDFEREMVNCLNRFFAAHHIPGYASRPPHRRPANRSMDVLADSPDPSYSIGFKCKSISDRKLYFSQHFPVDRDNVHQVDTITDYLQKTGRTGYLAVEFRQGPERPGQAFLIPWPVVIRLFRDSNGISLEDARSCIVLGRSKEGYRIASLNAK
jgi:Holliday junction resolvase